MKRQVITHLQQSDSAWKNSTFKPEPILGQQEARKHILRVGDAWKRQKLSVVYLTSLSPSSKYSQINEPTAQLLRIQLSASGNKLAEVKFSHLNPFSDKWTQDAKLPEEIQNFCQSKAELTSESIKIVGHFFRKCRGLIKYQKNSENKQRIFSYLRNCKK